MPYIVGGVIYYALVKGCQWTGYLAMAEFTATESGETYGYHFFMKRFGTLMELQVHRETRTVTVKIIIVLTSVQFAQDHSNNRHSRTATFELIQVIIHTSTVTAGWLLIKQSSHLKHHEWRRHSKEIDRPYLYPHCSKRYAQNGTWIHTVEHIIVLRDQRATLTSA